MDPPVNSRNAQYLFSGRSIKSVDSQNKNTTISPWRGDELYSKIKKSIHPTTRSKSATTNSSKMRALQNKSTNKYSRINTVQIQLTQFHLQSSKKTLSKWAQPTQMHLFHKQNALPSDKNGQKEKPYRFTTVSFVQPETNQRKLSVKCFAPRIKLQHINSEISRRKLVQKGVTFQDVDQKKSLMFFFEVRNHKVVNRERMVMRLRNIEKNRATRAFNHIN